MEWRVDSARRTADAMRSPRTEAHAATAVPSAATGRAASAQFSRNVAHFPWLVAPIGKEASLRFIVFWNEVTISDRYSRYSSFARYLSVPYPLSLVWQVLRALSERKRIDVSMLPLLDTLAQLLPRLLLPWASQMSRSLDAWRAAPRRAGAAAANARLLDEQARAPSSTSPYPPAPSPPLPTTP